MHVGKLWQNGMLSECLVKWQIVLNIDFGFGYCVICYVPVLDYT